MAGYDLVTWSPRIGSSGDDKYNVYGTQLDGSSNNSDITVIEAGGSSYSSPPTIAEINSSSGWNQVIGLVNRRASIYDTTFGTSIGTLSYVAAGDAITASVISAVRAKINSIRSAEGFSAYSFSFTPSAGDIILGRHLAECRKALGIYGILTLTGAHREYNRIDDPFGTPLSEANLNTGACQIGLFGEGTTQIRRRRVYIGYKIPEWVSALDSAKIKTAGFFTEDHSLQLNNCQVHSTSNHNFPPTLSSYSGDFYDNANFEDYIADPAVSTPYEWIMTDSIVIGQANNFYCVIFSQDEINDVILASPPYGTAGSYATHASGTRPYMEIDFGS